MANALKTNGAIGYVGIDYAIPNKLTVAAISNAAGKYVLPSQKSIRAGASWIKKVPASNILHPANPPKAYKTAYPATAFSYVIMRKGSPEGRRPASDGQLRTRQGPWSAPGHRLRAAAEGRRDGRQEGSKEALAPQLEVPA